MTFGARFGQLVRKYREAENWTAKQLAEEAFDDEAKRTRISELENGKVAKPHATTIHALSTTLGISDEEIEDCRTPPPIEDRKDHPAGDNVSLAQDVRQMSRAQLESLARRFGIDEAEGLADSKLVALLENKAEDLERLSTEIEALRGLSDRIDNIVAAARAAAESGDLEEAEEIVASAKESLNEQLIEPLERNWRLATTQADIALLRGRTQQAYDLISAAADAFAAIDPIEPARRRIYHHRLYDNALRYGGDGFLLTIAMQRAALDLVNEEDQPDLFGDAQGNLGNALRVQGSRTGGEEGAKLLAEAVQAFRATLRVYNETDNPLLWAQTQTNLGAVLRNLGSGTNGKSGAKPLAEAVTAYRAALRVRTEADHPVDWAMTQNNLGVALNDQGSRTGAEEGAKLMAEAVDAFHAALRVRTEADQPVQWAMTQNNLGNALADRGERQGGDEGANLLAEAVTAYRAALRVHPETDSPVQWAETQENLAIAELAMAEHETCTDPRPHLQAALAHVDNALSVYDPEHMPLYHEEAARTRERILAKLAALEE